jgi:hypothetical protein
VLMASDKPAAATVTDPDGREVVLLARIWEDKITRDHPELVDHLEAVMETVAKPNPSSRTRFPTGRGSTGVAPGRAAG